MFITIGFSILDSLVCLYHNYSVQVKKKDRRWDERKANTDEVI